VRIHYGSANTYSDETGWELRLSKASLVMGNRDCHTLFELNSITSA